MNQWFLIDVTHIGFPQHLNQLYLSLIPFRTLQKLDQPQKQRL